jgi:peroxiredoxin
MSDAVPPEPPSEAAPAAGTDGPFVVRRPRKRFIFIGLGIGLLIILIVGLTTSIGTSPSTSAPKPNGPLPAFSRQNVGPSGQAQVSVPGGDGSGTPAVLLFFGNWCPSCHQELPPLAATVQAQEKSGGALAKVRVIGVDSEDSVSKAKSFIKAAGVTFPVAYDADASLLSGLFYFRGDPNAVFVRGDGTIDKIVQGDGLTPSSFTADERALFSGAT